MKRINMAGFTKGRLKVIAFHGKQGRSILWLCNCECGKTCLKRGENLRFSREQSCGCLYRERSLNKKSRETYYRECRENGKFRKRYLAAIYNITPEKYLALLAEQNGKCFLCFALPTSKNNGGREYLAVDHDHRCCPGTKSCGKCIRKLLCLMCNKMLAESRDNPDVLRKGAEYLEHHWHIDTTT